MGTPLTRIHTVTHRRHDTTITITNLRYTNRARRYNHRNKSYRERETRAVPVEVLSAHAQRPVSRTTDVSPIADAHAVPALPRDRRHARTRLVGRTARHDTTAHVHVSSEF